ncbi:MAG TPA: hypothetical protein VEB43_07960 [Anaeromyxobacter sp.]|nr:hypothetical protein [Anaeromyxobacter sp.]
MTSVDPRERPADPRRRTRWPFWVFVAAMVLALLGGGAIALLVKWSPDQRNFAAEPRGPANPAP